MSKYLLPKASNGVTKRVERSPNIRRVSDIAEDEILFYDIETDHQYAPYAKLKLLGVKYGFEGKYIEVHGNKREQARFKEAMESPEILKVGFNNLSFDDIVLERYGYHVNEKGLHDGFLMMKAIAPMLPSYSLKFINWWYFGDPHFPEMEVQDWIKKHAADYSLVPRRLMQPYLAHDLEQHKNVFCLAWENVQRSRHAAAYALDLSQGPVIKEMVLKGGIWLDKPKIKDNIAILLHDRAKYNESASILSDGIVTNANSSKQLGAYLDLQGFELELTANSEFAVRKSDLVDIREHDPVAECAFQIRRINGELKYFENYLQALGHNPLRYGNWIPTSYSISTLRTRRFASSSLYGLNFQNPDEAAKTVQVVPQGWLGWWLDATQVENVVHIYESGDHARRRDYEANENWSEYVWLCNRILGTDATKDELDSIPSEPVPNWSVYKLYKTVKLGLNFGMGAGKFTRTTKIEKRRAERAFEDIHDACPAIRKLQRDVATRLERDGFVQDVFGHIYSGSIRQAYKVVAYLIQGCGTGSLPKAQMRANYTTIKRHAGDRGIMCTTTHDENSGRLDLSLGTKKIIAILQELQYNMTEKFSPLLDGIPLRAKLYLSKTTTANHVEVDVRNHEHVQRIIEGAPCSKCDSTGKLGKGKERRACPRCGGYGYL